MWSLNSNWSCWVFFFFYPYSHRVQYRSLSSYCGLQSAFLFYQGLQLPIKDFKMIRGESWSVPGDLGRVPQNSLYPLSIFSIVSNDLKGQQRWRGYERMLLTLLNYYSSQNQACGGLSGFFTLIQESAGDIYHRPVLINQKHFNSTIRAPFLQRQ